MMIRMFASRKELDSDVNNIKCSTHKDYFDDPVPVMVYGSDLVFIHYDVVFDIMIYEIEFYHIQRTY